MENKVKILPDHIANLIAAGEVVERPASVVKELLENSLDAGARRIDIVVRGGGKNLISVADNGHGMTRDDAIIAFERHATSKLSMPDDLNAVKTFGFRGEALPSIAAISQVELKTRPGDEIEGTSVIVEGGILKDVRSAGVPQGTWITVRSLYFNTPVRRKFLKANNIELQYILRCITETALVHPGVSFNYQVDSKDILSVPATTTMDERIYVLLGRDVYSGCEYFETGQGDVKIKGYIGRPELARGTRLHQHVFVNLRPVRQRAFSRILYDIYREYGDPKRFPVYLIFLEIPYELVDVNIHPSKMEVKFQNEWEILKILTDSLRKKFLEFAVPRIPAFHTKKREYEKYGETERRTDEKGGSEMSKPRLGFEAQGKGAGSGGGGSGVRASLMEPLISKEWHEPVRYWQLSNTYILTQMKDSLVLIDQHVAHERVLFEAAIKALTENKMESQQLLFPVCIELSVKEANLVEENKEYLERLGFAVNALGRATLALEGVPAILKSNDPGQIFREFLDSMEPGESPALEQMAKNFACKAAIKAGQPLNNRDMNQLVDGLFATENPFFCPHGRPIVVQIPISEIEKKFGR